MIKFKKCNLIPIVGVFVLLLIIVPPFATAREETVSLTFKKIAPSAEKSRIYTVKKGESLLDIIRNEIGVSGVETYRTLTQIKKLNPQIKNLNVIHAGQKILLPDRKKSVGDEPRDSEIPEIEITKKTMAPVTSRSEESAFMKYTVKRGDWLFQIIHDELGLSVREVPRRLNDIRKLNPHIGNINIIRPGDVLTLPAKRKTTPIAQEIAVKKKPIIDLRKETPSEKPDIPEKPFLTTRQELETINHVVSRMGGSVIQEGSFYIPLPPAGQMAINCSMVPIVEFNEGITMLLDFSNRVPENVKHIIESTWKNYIFIQGKKGSDTPSMLEGVIHASPYNLKRKAGSISVGNRPPINVSVDWIVSKKGNINKESNSFAITLLSDRESILNKTVRDYSVRMGVEIIDILRERGIAETTEPSSPMAPIIMNYDTKIQLAESALSMLGHVSTRDSNIKIFDVEKDGFDLSIKPDLSLTIDRKEIVFLFKTLPRQFLNTLEERGTTVVILSESMGRETILENILRATDTPFLSDKFSFPLASGRGAIVLAAKRVKSERGFLYFINYDIDRQIYGLLNEKWGVSVVKY